MSYYPGQRIEFSDIHGWRRGTIYGLVKYSDWWYVVPDDDDVAVARVEDDGTRLRVVYNPEMRPLHPLIQLAEAAE